MNTARERKAGLTGRTGALLAAMAATVVLGACGGGGGGSIDPYWLSEGVAAVDVNGDGRPDLIRARTYVSGPPPHSGYIEVRLQNADGSFATAVQYGVGNDPWGIAVADVNGDGRPDIVVANTNSFDVSILVQSASQPGTFLAALNVPMAAGTIPQGVAIGDLNGDGRADIAVAVYGTINGAVVLLQSPGPTLAFGGSRTLTTSGGATAVAIGDLDRDGRPDLAVSHGGGAAVFLQSATSGVFNAPLAIPAGIQPFSVAIADLDGDGCNDLVVGNHGNPSGATNSSVSVALQNCATPGTFAGTLTTVVANGVTQVVAARVLGNPQPDVVAISLVYSSPAPANVTVLGNPGNGVLASTRVLTGPAKADFIAVADVNGDGRLDLIANDGPAVALQSAATPGNFAAFTTVP